MNTGGNIIELHDIAFSYGEREVLGGISLDVPYGDYLGVVGPNGAGKTTLLKIILGLLKPSRGSVMLFGTDIKNLKSRSRIGYVPQKATNFDADFPATVYEVVLMGRYASRGLFHRIVESDRQFVKRALEDVDMWGFHDRLIGDLSGGQQQRVFIARALATQPDVMFLDEPTIGIDRRAREDFYDLLKKLNDGSGIALVLISHDIKMVTKHAKHIACINRDLTCHLSTEDFVKADKTQDLFSDDLDVFTRDHHHHHDTIS
ncbi:MAG: zinc ABC transporter ATP-binding protein [Candidatus Yonathbacteria bacterium CG_4_10_14_3_um_filter_47_65]|uniref:Zinc ABC transporter ATP-binding protein n=2 Tax=Parcubacteria group TaxID=1794811 RepID=A0A2M8D673_9BACT|nr:MAG: zinc ABC transporter ATP-binding protein [Candidatus Nomurabacteria bacterium CG1_02_47_685]PIP03273.1 MAG: zinc ABC transporter ATP-binding protein [Candidatus Yonathbacteria bacterium CG23_combo_of_CG06-09_8_20_14_all_46_18]PIQ32078.1 MAG: zinc ABC transporter ATP-binding protein [Candidatus Yonathbacteria bacterium CG17_big_fil_post_rev_8_21_14_2_50_46_19]PIX56379.1 MAG: zinc ABC transporter ATP-binding protein [Candidatus Yonathbacteria bacterium CG_4_10_14_3_um_filter_47_65]PIY5738